MLINIGIYNLLCALIYASKPLNINTNLDIDSKRVFVENINEIRYT